MKKIFLLLAFTGIVGAASATSLVALTKGAVITLCGDDKKQDDKKKCDKKKACCKSQTTASAQGSSGCTAGKAETKGCTHGSKAEGKKCTQSNAATAEVTKEVKSEVVAAPSVK